VLQYDLATGAFLGTFASVGGASTFLSGATFGPDGNLYVGEFNGKAILRFHGRTGAPLGTYATLPESPYSLAFGPGGHLYVGVSRGAVLRVDATTGAVGTYIASPGGADMGGFAFHGDSVFVSYIGSTGSVVQYDATTGLQRATLLTGLDGNGPRAPVFGPDGYLYVPVWQTRTVKKLAPPGWGFVGDIVNDSAVVNGQPVTPMSVAFAPSGELLVLNDPCCDGPDTVRRYDRNTGAFLGTLVQANAGGLGRANTLLVWP
jgi:hypothetical protein